MDITWLKVELLLVSYIVCRLLHLTSPPWRVDGSKCMVANPEKCRRSREMALIAKVNLNFIFARIPLRPLIRRKFHVTCKLPADFFLKNSPSRDVRPFNWMAIKVAYEKTMEIDIRQWRCQLSRHVNPADHSGADSFIFLITWPVDATKRHAFHRPVNQLRSMRHLDELAIDWTRQNYL